MDEQELNLDDLDQIESNVENKLKVKNRFQDLSEKVKTEAQKREEAETKLKAEADARLQAERERDFFKNFSSNTTKYPNAAQHQDEIWQKVQKGYELEDAMMLMSSKEQTPNTPKSSPTVEGGSAPTMLNDGGEKELKDMTREEKLEALMALEKRGGITL